ncbi:DUF6174 domain-containing protein [uncultured Nocardioides sp.]|uniref:DUF6174 domain-containing protein n=1 Tax=uncultured Nocardioides sp. TaxID=198441 RepID=UPI00260DB0A0|nr:DUF6174 domain-containing protein [uncultured Nocardioides sp.]HRD61267.1 DUF6174 domain-containing protein [Nocardioides sp.]
MEPISRTGRRTPMRALALTIAALALPLCLAGCGSEDSGGDVAGDPTPTVTSSSPPEPAPEPTVGSYPAFAPTDYMFTLTVSCFCMGAGTPIQVTVADSEVVDAAYTEGGGRGGAEPGEPADNAFRLTINDIIDRANDTEADKVTVDWPAGQDYPSSVYVDQQKNAADDEIGYTIEGVQVSP